MTVEEEVCRHFDHRCLHPISRVREVASVSEEIHLPRLKELGWSLLELARKFPLLGRNF